MSILIPPLLLANKDAADCVAIKDFNLYPATGGFQAMHNGWVKWCLRAVKLPVSLILPH